MGKKCAHGRPMARFGHSMVAVGSDLYVFGGFAGYTAEGWAYPKTSFSSELWKYCTKLFKWTKMDGQAGVTGRGASARMDHGMAVIGEDIFIFGGSVCGCGGGEDMEAYTQNSCVRALGWADDVDCGGLMSWQSWDSSFSAELFRYSTTARAWTRLDQDANVTGPVPSARSGAAMVAVASDLYVYGGRTGSDRTIKASTFSSDLFRYSSVTCVWTKLDQGAGAPSARWGHAMVAIGSSLIVFGGRTGFGERIMGSNEFTEGSLRSAFSSELYAYFTHTNAWARISVTGAPSARTGHQIVDLGNALLLFGGYESLSSFPDLGPSIRKEMHLQYASEPALLSMAAGADHEQAGATATTGAFQPLLTEPELRYDHAMASVGAYLYVFGGASMPWNERHSTFYRYCTKKKAWSQFLPDSGGTFPSARAGHTMVAVGTIIYLFGGIGASGKELFFKYDTSSMTWIEARLTGTAPSARHRHAMAHISKIIYLFGGKELEGET
jgi:N-acetylneuraminic acid mutarotase